MPDSVDALLMMLVALLPGALYVWAFERQAGRYGIRLSDRLLRFVGGSSVFLAVCAVPLYALWATYWDSLSRGEPVPLWLGLVRPHTSSCQCWRGRSWGLACGTVGSGPTF